MFTRRVTIFQLFGFDIKIDATWIFLAVLVTWSLKTYFSLELENLPQYTYWAMGVLGAVGLFASIIFHELGHSVVARRFGIPIRDITLFIFGGVASMEDEPPSAKSEFFMAIAGPIVSLVLCIVFLIAHMLAPQDAVIPALEVVGWLAWINGMLAGFNLIPAFPLDGGRVLRAMLWGYRGNLRWATRIASFIGSMFGYLLIFLGIFEILNGLLFTGVWSLMLGFFVRNASQMSYRQVLFRNALEGERVRRFMKTDPVTVPRYISIQELVEAYIYKYQFKMYPVVDGDRLTGCISVADVRQIPREDWASTPVGEIMESCSAENSVHPDEDAMHALMNMNRTGNTRLLVLEEGRLVGIIALKDLLRFLSLKMDLEEGAS